MDAILLHTDGSCETQSHMGGWAAVLRSGTHERVLQGSASDTTANAMELTAVVEGLSALKKPGAAVQVFTDSSYIVKGATQWLSGWVARGWKNARGQEIAHLALWQQLKTLLDQHHVTLTWVPREDNTQADQLAQQARTKHEGHETVEAAPSHPTQETRLLIAGSRYATREAIHYARRVVRRAHELGCTILVGDNPKGVDMAVVQECRRLKADVIVVGVTNGPRNGGCTHGSYVKVDRDTYRSVGGRLLDRYAVRDRYLADMAQRGVFIWNGQSAGTKAGYDYMVGRGKETHLVTFKRG
jgi:ribonuclease HI